MEFCSIEVSVSFFVFQPRYVSSPNFCVLMPTLVGENYRWSETTSFLLGFSTCRATNRFLQRELCHVEVWCLLMFFRPGLTLLPTTMFCWRHWWEKVSKHMKLLHPLLHSPQADPQTNLYSESSAMVKFNICSCVSNQVWLFCLLQCFGDETDGVNFHSVWNYYIPSCILHLQSHKWIFVERDLPRWSSTTAHVFRPGLTLLPTPVFRFWNWWDKVL
jgi:hypothetical protein